MFLYNSSYLDREQNNEYPTRDTVLLLLIILIGTVLRFWGIQWGLPYEYQSEEYKVIKYALHMGSGDLNPHFFEYPSLYLYFMLFLYGIYYLLWRFFNPFGTSEFFASSFLYDPTPFYLIGRGAEAVFGIGLIFLTYYIGKRFVSAKVGLLASLLIAILPDFVNKAHMAKGDTAAIFLGLIFWLLCTMIYETGRRKWYLWAGAVLGLAISTKYYMIFMGITLPLAHLLRQDRQKLRYFIFSLLLVPIFFFIGSPYLIVEYKNLLDILSPDFYTNLYSGRESNYLYRLVLALINLIRLSDFNFYFGIDSYGLGIFSLAGLIFLLRSSFPSRTSPLSPQETPSTNPFSLQETPTMSPHSLGKSHSMSPLSLWERARVRGNVYFLLIIPILTYCLCVATYHNPAGGYLAPIFPLFLICASTFIIECLSQESLFFSSLSFRRILSRLIGKLKSKDLISLLFLFSTLTALGASIQRSYSYTLEDTRTLAKKWIDENIPFGSKLLMDTPVNSPPLGMARKQLERLYDMSVKLNHYKKDYFKLKLLMNFGITKPSYEIFLIKRSAAEIGSLQKQVEEVQKVQDLIEVEGTASDFERLTEKNIQYVIVNSSDETGALTQHPHLANFYLNLPKYGKMVKSFVPKNKIHPGPAIKIYQLKNSIERSYYEQ